MFELSTDTYKYTDIFINSDIIYINSRDFVTENLCLN